MKKLTVSLLTLILALPLASSSEAQGNQAKIDQLRNGARNNEQLAKEYDAKALRYENAAKATPKPKPAAISKYEADAKTCRDLAEVQRKAAKEKLAEAERLEKAQR